MPDLSGGDAAIHEVVASDEPAQAGIEDKPATAGDLIRTIDRLLATRWKPAGADQANAAARVKHNYIGSPACLLLDQALMVVHAAFPNALGIYQVGSSLTTPDWRDIDVRLMLADDEFERWFGDPYQQGCGDAFWSLFCAAVSRHLSAISGLPIDFQVQGMTRANILNKGLREPIGIFRTPKCADEIEPKEPRDDHR